MEEQLDEAKDEAKQAKINLNLRTCEHSELERLYKKLRRILK